MGRRKSSSHRIRDGKLSLSGRVWLSARLGGDGLRQLNDSMI
jgi:hypothetical protein